MGYRKRLYRLIDCAFICGTLILIYLSCARLARAQQSYRTQHSFAQSSRVQPQSDATATGPARSSPPLRFLGWRQAMRQGPDAVRYFQALLSHRWPTAMNAPSARRGSSNSIASALANSSGFSPAQLPGILFRPSMPAGALPVGIATGDFNGDGKLDWAVANGGDNTVYVYLGNGDGTSQPPAVLQLSGESPVGIVAADLNGDGKLDLALVEADSNTIGILFGNGDGTFQPEVEMPVANAQPLGIAAADLNHDGKPDLIVGLLGSGPTLNLDFEVLLNKGGGQFSAPIYAPKLISDGIDEGFGISVGDMNGDGIPDLLITGADAFSTTLKTYFGKGDGSFTPGVMVWGGNPAGGADVGAAVLADVNDDHCPDITTAEDIGDVLVFYNDCSGNSPAAPSVTYGVADGAISLAVADVNGDGFPDIVTGSMPNQNAGAGYGYSPGNSLTVRLNDGTGSFGPARVFVGDPGMVGLSVADLQNNGRPDIITANQNTNSTTVYLNDGSGGYGEPGGGYDGYMEGVPTSPVNAPITGFATADVDGDGKPDLVLVENTELGSYENTEPLTVLLNQGNGQFGLPIRSVINATGAVYDFVLADFRKIGRPDFLGFLIHPASGPAPALVYAQNIGGGQFGSPVTITFPTSYDYGFGTLAVGDFNNDGKLDFAVCAPGGTSQYSNAASDALIVYLGNGDGTFSASPFQTTFANGADCQAMFVGNSTGNGKADIFMRIGSANIGTTLYEARGNGDGTFSTPTQVLPNLSDFSMVDLNHDGLLDVVDIAIGPQGTNPPQVNIYLGKPDGTFSSSVSYSPYPGPFAVALGSGEPDNLIQSFGPYIGDFNGDGNLDIAVFQYTYLGTLLENMYAQLLIGNGDGTFTPSFDHFNFGAPLVPDLAAFNLLGDAKTALVVAAGFTSAFQIFPSTQAPFLQAQMDETPLLSGSDGLDVSLDVPASSDTTVSLSASNANVQIPATATIPAGQLSVDVPFSVAPTMPLNQWFSISAQSNGTTAVAYNFVPAPGSVEPFLLNVIGGFITNAPSTPGPGEASFWTANVSSTGIGSSTFQLSCSGLPAGASCANFSPANFPVGPGETNGSTFTITTNSAIAPGLYPFTMSATDGFTLITANPTLRIGDFSLALQPGSLNVPPSGSAKFTLTLTDLFGYGETVTLSCSNLPSGASCPSQGVSAYPGPEPFAVNLNGVAAGNYTFTLTGTSPALTHSVTGQLQVASQALAALNQSTLAFGTLLVGNTSQSQTVSLTNAGNIALDLTNIVAAASPGANGSFAQTNNCGSSLGPSASCTINVTFSPSAVGSSAGTLTLTDNAAGSPQVVSLSGSAVDFSIVAAPGSSTSATVSAGQTATFNLQIQGNQLSNIVNLSCSSAPSHASCTTIPAAVYVSGATPVAFQVQVLTSAGSGILSFKNDKPIGTLTELFAFSAILLVIAAAWSDKRRLIHRCLALGALIVLLAVVWGCGGGGTSQGGGVTTNNPATPAGTYTIVVTGQSESGTRSMSLSLTVQ
jgi:hypothetical protein